MGNKKARDLRPGDLVDMEGWPGLSAADAMHAECEYYPVVGVERETADCVRVDMEGLSYGFAPDALVPLGRRVVWETPGLRRYH